MAEGRQRAKSAPLLQLIASLCLATFKKHTCPCCDTSRQAVVMRGGSSWLGPGATPVLQTRPLSKLTGGSDEPLG